MASFKPNSHRHESNAMKIRRNNVRESMVKGDNSLLKPATDLNSFGKAMFKAIKENNPQLQNGDNYLLNLLCSEYQIYVDSLDYLNKHGLVTKDGKKSPYYSILKQSIDEISKLSSKLDLTPDDRAGMNFKQQDHGDPLKQAVNNE